MSRAHLKKWQRLCACGRVMAHSSDTCRRCYERRRKENSRLWHCHRCETSGRENFYEFVRYLCRECHKADARRRSAELFAQDPDLCRERMLRSYYKHATERRRKAKRYYYANRERLLAYQRDYKARAKRRAS